MWQRRHIGDRALWRLYRSTLLRSVAGAGWCGGVATERPARRFDWMHCCFLMTFFVGSRGLAWSERPRFPFFLICFACLTPSSIPLSACVCSLAQAERRATAVEQQLRAVEADARADERVRRAPTRRTSAIAAARPDDRGYPARAHRSSRTRTPHGGRSRCVLRHQPGGSLRHDAGDQEEVERLKALCKQVDLSKFVGRARAGMSAADVRPPGAGRRWRRNWPRSRRWRGSAKVAAHTIAAAAAAAERRV